MTDQRAIIEMGMGNDQYGMDYTKAAGRAIEDALRHSSLAIFKSTGIDPASMRIKVTVGVQDPDKTDAESLKTKLPYGSIEMHIIKGGLNVTNPETGTTIVIASAAVEVFLSYQGNNWRAAKS